MNSVKKFSAQQNYNFVTLKNPPLLGRIKVGICIAGLVSPLHPTVSFLYRQADCEHRVKRLAEGQGFATRKMRTTKQKETKEAPDLLLRSHQI